MTSKSRRFKPDTKHESARQLARLWYVDLYESGKARYVGVGGRAVLTQGKAADRAWRSDKTPTPVCGNCGRRFAYHPDEVCRQWAPVTRLSARGTETRQYRPGHVLTDPIDLTASGHSKADRELEFAKQAMRHLALISRDCRECIEMWCAGYSLETIGDEHGCGEWRAGQYVEAALTCLHSLQILRPF